MGVVPFRFPLETYSIYDLDTCFPTQQTNLIFTNCRARICLLLLSNSTPNLSLHSTAHNDVAL